MAFTQATITHTFQNADGTPASGAITFALTKRITNGTTTIIPAEITASLNANGQLSQALTANNDPGTTPQDSQWAVTFRITAPGAPVTEEFFITVPTGGGTVDLGSLLPDQTQGG